MKDAPGLGRVVVGEKDEGALRVRRPDLADDVPGGLVLGDRLTHQARSIGDVVGDQRRSGRAGRCGEPRPQRVIPATPAADATAASAASRPANPSW